MTALIKWRKRDLEAQQQEAEQAVIMSQVSYLAATTLEREAAKVARGHRRLQRENHLGEKMFGVRHA